MNGSETLTSSAQTDTEAAYVYQRADGSVERANSAAEAFNLCPVLREMAQENPEQANVLLELAAVGREKMDKENKEEKDEPEIEEKLIDKQREATEIKKPVSPAKSEHSTQSYQLKQIIEIAEAEPKGSEKPAEIAATHSVEQVIHQSLVEISDNKPSRSEQSKMPESPQSSQAISKDEKIEQASQSQIFSRGQDKVEVRGVYEVVNTTRQAELRNVLPQQQETSTNKEIEVKSPAQSEILDMNKNQVEAYFEVPTLETETLNDIKDTEKGVALNEIENFSEDYEIAELTATYHISEIDNEAPVSYEAELYTEEQLEELFNPETVETYKELLALTDCDEIEPLAVEEQPGAQTEVSFEIIENDVEEHSFNKFEAYIAEQPIIEEPITLETIQEQANEQPLEQTLVQLAELLASDAEYASEPEQVELYQILREIEAGSPACYYISQETEEPKLRITPELTEKLLALLRHLGYEHPKEALVDLVKQYGLAFLLQAMQYICQLNSEDEKQEFAIASVSIVKDDDENTRLRIGKALFGLISELNFETAQTSTI